MALRKPSTSTHEPVRNVDDHEDAKDSHRSHRICTIGVTTERQGKKQPTEDYAQRDSYRQPLEEQPPSSQHWNWANFISGLSSHPTHRRSLSHTTGASPRGSDR